MAANGPCSLEPRALADQGEAVGKGTAVTVDEKIPVQVAGDSTDVQLRAKIETSHRDHKRHTKKSHLQI